MNRYGLMAQRHWAQWLPQRYATISDPDSYFSTLGQEAARQIDDLTLELAGRRPAGRGVPGEGGPADRGAQPGRGDRAAAAGPADTGTGDQRGPGGRQPAAGEPGPAAGRGPQPPGLGGGERRADGAGAGQLAARFRPRSQDDLAPSGTVARTRANLAALATLRAIQRDAPPGIAAGAGGPGPLVGLGRGPRGLR